MSVKDLCSSQSLDYIIKQMVEMYIKAVHAVGACICNCKVVIMQCLERNLSKCAAIV